jgi:hypothetical protein
LHLHHPIEAIGSNLGHRNSMAHRGGSLPPSKYNRF